MSHLKLIVDNTSGKQFVLAEKKMEDIRDGFAELNHSLSRTASYIQRMKEAADRRNQIRKNEIVFALCVGIIIGFVAGGAVVFAIL